MIVVEQHGKIFSLTRDGNGKADLFHDFTKEPKLQLTKDANQFDAVYGFTFDPMYRENRYCYVCYTVKNDKQPNLENGSRVSRFKVVGDAPPRLESASEEIILTYLQGGHNGGDLHFGPDGYLYITTGDATDPNPPDRFKTGQDVSDLLSSVLRIDIRQKDPNTNYAIPKDNPFVNQAHNGKPIRGEVWAYGFRNPWRMSFDRMTGDLWLGDVGWESWEMIHKIEKGGNYGWSLVEAGQTVNSHHRLGPTPIRPPAIELSHSIAASVTGGYVYRGKKFPELQGRYIFGDWMTRRLWAATIQNSTLVQLEEITAPTVRVVAFGVDHDGELYLLDYDAGTIHTLERNTAAEHDPAKFPRTLSTTGLFSQVRTHQLASGVVPFTINAHQWQDYATAEYFIALPGTTSVQDYENKKPFANDVSWNPIHFHVPKDAVVGKTISLEMEKGNPQSRKRIETQILHFDGEAIQGYTFAWRDDQSDADLVPADGGETLLRIRDANFGGIRPQNWTFASRVQCGQCHNPWAGYWLGFNREQLHRELPNGINQLVELHRVGVLKRIGNENKPLPAYSRQELATIRRVVDPFDPSQSINDRARSYLDVNCGHCHRFGGGGSVEFHIHRDADLKSKHLWDAKPTRGTFDLSHARILAPGDPKRSVLYYRMAKFGSGRMPHLGSDLPDEQGLRLIHDWIRSLEPGKEALGTPVKYRKDQLIEGLRRPESALEIARAVARGSLDPDERSMVRDIVTADACDVRIRDLLAGYFPDPNRAAVLGSNPRPRAILMLTGDPANGRKLYDQKRSQCSTCHKMDGQGSDIGPDLSSIAKSRSREQILESILQPSRRIEPQYQAYQVQLVSGQTHFGLVVKRDDQELLLRGTTGQMNRIPAVEVESIEASRTSIMPEGLLRDFTAQEAADLLAFLMTKK